MSWTCQWSSWVPDWEKSTIKIKCRYFGADNFSLFTLSILFTSANYFESHTHLARFTCDHHEKWLSIGHDTAFCWQATIVWCLVQLYNIVEPWDMLDTQLATFRFNFSSSLLLPSLDCWSDRGEVKSVKRMKTYEFSYWSCLTNIHNADRQKNNTGQQFVMCFLTLTCPDLIFPSLIFFRNISNYKMLQWFFFEKKSRSLSTHHKKIQVRSLKLRKTGDREKNPIEIEYGRCVNWCDNLS